jgi:hypothetical protein
MLASLEAIRESMMLSKARAGPVSHPKMKHKSNGMAASKNRHSLVRAKAKRKGARKQR